MIAACQHRGCHYLLLIGVSYFMFFLNLGGPTLWDVDEGRNGACSTAMMMANNWIIPTFNGELRVDKPALLYWLQIFAYRAFGVSEFAARFPSALAALATVLLAYELARSMFTRMTGLLAGSIFASMPMAIGTGRFANPDALLNSFTALTFAIFWLGFAQRRWWWFLLLGASTGLAMLAKGPVGLLLPAAACAVFLLWTKQVRVLWDRRWNITIWAFILTAFPWYIWVGIETHGEFLSGFFVEHNLSRGLAPMDTHAGFPGYYFLVLLGGTLPWSIFLPSACWFGFWSAIRSPWAPFRSWWTWTLELGSDQNQDGSPDLLPVYRFLFSWMFVYLAFFSIAATKLPNYILPACLPCAILIARLLQRWCSEAVRLPNWLLASVAACWIAFGISVTLGCAIGGGVGAAPEVRQHLFPGLESWALLGAIPIAAALAGCWFLRQRRFDRFVGAFGLSVMLFYGPMAAFGVLVFNDAKAPRPFVELLDLQSADEDIRIGCFQQEHLPSLNFYAQRDIEHLPELTDIPGFMSYRVPVYLLLRAEDWRHVRGTVGGVYHVVGRHRDTYRAGEVVVVTNR